MRASSRYRLGRVILAFLLAIVGLLVIAPWVTPRLGDMDRQRPTADRRPPTIDHRPDAPTRILPIESRVRVGASPPTAQMLPERALNGIPLEQIVVLTQEARVHIRDLYAQGQQMGRNARAFSKVGDSTMVYPPFLEAFDANAFHLGRFAPLQPTIDYYAGSFARPSLAVKKGMHTWSEFDPEWADPQMCLPGEGPLACEVRVHNPSIALIRLGANDTPSPDLFRTHLERIVQFSLDHGIIPVLGTKPDRQEGASNYINALIRRTAAAYQIPLWDYDLIAGTVPGRGLEADGVHMRGDGTRNFTLALAFQSGDALQDLTALLMLDAIRRELNDSSPNP